MGRPKRQSDVASPSRTTLLRARASRDVVLRSIRNLAVLVQEVLIDVEKEPVFKARCVCLEEYVE